MGYTHGKQWTDELITDEIIRVVATLNLKHFPTHSEMYSFYGNRALTNAVAKNGGTEYWAKKLNLKIKQSESNKGAVFEKYAISDIKNNTGFNSYPTKPRYPYDLVTDTHIKVDIKVSYPYTNKDGVITNTFNLEKSEPTCDIFILYCLKKDGSIFKTLVIPSCVLAGQTQVGVGLLSKWDSFVDKWDFFEMYSDFYHSVTNNTATLPKRRSAVVNWG